MQRVGGARASGEGAANRLRIFSLGLALSCSALTCRPPQPPTPVSRDEPPPVGARAEPPRVDPVVHFVRRGETLSQIARRYRVPLDEIARLNRLADPDRIDVNQRLLLPDGAQAGAAADRSPLSRHRRELDLAEQQLAAADFAGAEARAERLRDQVDPTEPGAAQVLVQIEQISAHVYVALGRPELATAAFARALQIDPGYRPPASSPPKLMRAFREATSRDAAR